MTMMTMSVSAACRRQLAGSVILRRQRRTNAMISSKYLIESQIDNNRGVYRQSSMGILNNNTSVPYHPFSTKSCHAIVDHAVAYQESMVGRHGKQLALAYDEGIGKDDEIDYFANVDDDDVDDEEEVLGEQDDEEDTLDDESSDEEEYDDQDNDEDLLDEDDEYQDTTQYNNDGSPVRPASELVALRSGAPAGGTFAIVRLGGFQHKVSKDDLVICNKLLPTSKYRVGATLTLSGDDVLLVADTDRTLVGLPGVHGARVDILVEEITHDKTVLVFKKRRRKNSRRKNGFRREVTFVRILDIRMPDEGESE